MTVIREGANPDHFCDIPGPNGHGLRTVAKCDQCGRRWRLIRIGWSFKGWRRTPPTILRDLLRRSKGRQQWVDIYKEVGDG